MQCQCSNRTPLLPTTPTWDLHKSWEFPDQILTSSVAAKRLVGKTGYLHESSDVLSMMMNQNVLWLLQESLPVKNRLIWFALMVSGQMVALLSPYVRCYSSLHCGRFLHTGLLENTGCRH